MEELRVANDEIEAIILPAVGARFHRLRAFGHDLLRTPGDVAEHLRDPFFWGGFVMAPWCNRIRPGAVQVGSRQVTVRPNFSDGSAIHGQVYASPWQRAEDGSLRVRGGGGGWPWAYDTELRIELNNQQLRLELALTNSSDEEMPAGLGFHPWFRRPLLLAIRAAAVYGDRWAASPQPQPVDGDFDLRRLGEMPPDLDATWTGLQQPPVELVWPVPGIRLTMRTTGTTTHVVAANPPHLDAIAVEPQTHAPQGLRRLIHGQPGALAMLAPEATLKLTAELSFESPRRAPDHSPA